MPSCGVQIILPDNRRVHWLQSSRKNNLFKANRGHWTKVRHHVKSLPWRVLMPISLAWANTTQVPLLPVCRSLMGSPFTSSTRLLWIWKAGVTQWPHEHCSPCQWKEPNFDEHFGHRSCKRTKQKCGSLNTGLQLNQPEQKWNASKQKEAWGLQPKMLPRSNPHDTWLPFVYSPPVSHIQICLQAMY